MSEGKPSDEPAHDWCHSYPSSPSCSWHNHVEHGVKWTWAQIYDIGNIVMKNDKSVFKVFGWMRARKKRQKGKTVIEFCKDKCWNTSPYWMQLAGGPRIIIMMKNRKQTKQRVSKNLHLLCYDITVSNPACQHCIYSIKTPLASAAWHAVCLHTPYKYYMQCT